MVVTHKFALIRLESTEQQAVLTLHFEYSWLKSLDKILQEGPHDFSYPVCLPIIMSHHHPCDEISQAFPLSDLHTASLTLIVTG